MGTKDIVTIKKSGDDVYHQLLMFVSDQKWNCCWVDHHQELLRTAFQAGPLGDDIEVQNTKVPISKVKSRSGQPIISCTDDEKLNHQSIGTLRNAGIKERCGVPLESPGISYAAPPGSKSGSFASRIVDVVHVGP